MKLYPIFASGITAYGSDVITDPFKLDTIYFLAVCGYQATVKGIIANLLENRGIRIKLDGKEHYLERSDLGYKVLLKKLPSGFGQAILFPSWHFPKTTKPKRTTFTFSHVTMSKTGSVYSSDIWMKRPIYPCIEPGKSGCGGCLKNKTGSLNSKPWRAISRVTQSGSTPSTCVILFLTQSGTTIRKLSNVG